MAVQEGGTERVKLGLMSGHTVTGPQSKSHPKDQKSGGRSWDPWIGSLACKWVVVVVVVLRPR